MLFDSGYMHVDIIYMILLFAKTKLAAGTIHSILQQLLVLVSNTTK